MIILHQYATFFVSSTHLQHHLSFYFQSMPLALLNFVSQEFVHTMEAQYRWRASRMMGEVVCFQNMLIEVWESINFSSRLAKSGLSSKTHHCCPCNTFTQERNYWQIVCFSEWSVESYTLLRRIQMKINLMLAYNFCSLGLIFVLKKNHFFFHFNRTAEPDQSILI